MVKHRRHEEDEPARDRDETPAASSSDERESQGEGASDLASQIETHAKINEWKEQRRESRLRLVLNHPLLTPELNERCAKARIMERTLNGRFILESQREEARQLAKELIAAGFISTECELLLRVSKSTPNFWPPDTSPQRTKRRLVARAMREQGIVPVPRKGPVYLETFNLDTQPAPTQLVEQTDEGGNFVIIMGRGNALSKAMASLKDFLKN